MKIVVAHLLDPTANALAEKLSKDCEPYAMDPPLLLQEHSTENPAIPHLSHIHLDIAEENIGQLHATLRKLIDDRQQPVVKAAFSSIGHHGHWLFWRVEATLALRLLHRSIVEVAAPLRQADLTVSRPITIFQKEMAKRYGYPYCGECFDPHVTLSVIRDPNHLQADNVRAYARTWFPWQSDLLVIGQLGPRGVMTKVLGRLPLY